MPLHNWFGSPSQSTSRRARSRAESHQTSVERLEQRSLLDATAIATELLLNTQTARAQLHDIRTNQTVTGLPDGGFVSVWQSRGQDGSGFGIFGQRFDATGAKVNTEFQVSQTTRRHQRAASVVSADDGRFAVAWQSRGQDGSGNAVMARVFNADGSAATDEFLVNQTSRGLQGNADVAFLNDGNLVFTWRGRGPADRNGVVARVFAADGSAVSAEIQVNQTTRGRQLDPTVAADSTGGFWISWHGRGIGDRGGVFARRFDAAGTTLDGEFPVNSVSRRLQKKPSIAASDDGRVLIAWQSWKQDGRGFGVFAQLYNVDGTTSGNEFQVNQTSHRSQFRPAVDFTPDGGFAVAWTGRGPGDRWGIFVREYNPDATPEGNERLVNQTTKGWQSRPGISRTTNGFVVTWSGRGNRDRRGVFATLFEETPATALNLLPISDVSVDELQTVSVTAAVESPVAGTQFSFVGTAPDGASIDAATGDITWTPTEAQGPGTFDFTVQAEANGETDQETFQVTVAEVNVAPVLNAISNRTSDPGSAISLTASATDTDLPANNLTYSLGEGAPPDAVIDSTTGAFSWPIPASQPTGDVSITVQVTDDGSPQLSDSQTFAVSVVASPSSPVLSVIADQSVDEGATVSFTASATDADLPNDQITYSLAAGAPAGASINPTTGEFSWLTSEADGPSVVNVTVIATDGSGRTDQDTVQITVNEVNQSPVLAAIADRTADPGTTIAFTASATDADTPANNLTYRLAAGAPNDATINATTGEFSWLVPPGQSAGDVAITVEVTDDGSPSLVDSESFTVAVNALPQISVADVTAAEGDAGTTPFTFTVTMSEASAQQVTVDFSTNPGTADGADFQASSGTLTFAAGVTSQTVTVNVTGDTSLEVDETFSLILSNPSSASIADGEAIGTIENDDTVPAVRIADTIVSEADGTATLTLTISAAPGSGVSVDASTTAGTATAGSDFTQTSSPVSFAAGQTTQTLVVPILQDSIDEPDETFSVSLSNPAGLTIADGTATVTITDDDPAPSLSVDSVALTEGDTGQQNLQFTVTLDAASGQTATVNFATSDGTAVGSADYVSNSGTLTFPPGTTQQTIAVSVLGDTIAEPNETFTVALSDPANALIAQGTGTGTIQNDDTIPVITVADVATGESSGQMTFTAQLSATSQQQVTVDFATGDQTATAGADYTATTGTLTFAPGELQQQFSVPLTDDTTDEPNETLVINFTSVVNATLNASLATGTILDDDQPVTISIADANVSEGDATPGPVAFATSTLTAGNAPESVAAGRLSTDLTPDLVVANFDDDTISVRISNGDGTFQNESLLSTGDQPSSVVAVDLTADGLAELVTANRGDSTLTVFTNSAGTFSGSSISLTGVPLSVVAGDFIGDANVDLAVAIQGATAADPATVAFLPGAGDGTFGTATTFSTGIDPFLLLAAELNGSGKTELVSVNDTSGPAVITNSGTDTFSTTPLTATGNPVSGVPVDVDSDGDNDLLLVTTGATAMHVFPNDGTGSFGTPVTTPLSLTVIPDARSVAAGDFNNDTFADVVIVDANQDIAAVLTGNNDGTFTASDTFNVGAAPFGVVAADLNADGGLDLATADFVGNSITTLFSSRQQTNAAFVITLSAASQQAVTVEFSTANNSAEDESGSGDFTSTSGTVTFQPGETQKTVFVPITDDLSTESLEQFFINLLNPLNATILDGQGIGSITDND